MKYNKYICLVVDEQKLIKNYFKSIFFVPFGLGNSSIWLNMRFVEMGGASNVIAKRETK